MITLYYYIVLYYIIYSHFPQTIGALVAVSPADSPLKAKTVPTFRRRASSVAGNSNDDYILGLCDPLKRAKEYLITNHIIYIKINLNPTMPNPLNLRS